MSSIHESSAQEDGARPRWLALIHQLPPTPDYLRVKVRRRLQQLGALALKNSVYLLPNAGDALEDFLWLRQEILADGGDATVWATNIVAGPTDPEIEEAFRAERDAEYEVVRNEASRATPGTAAQRLRRQLEGIVSRDYFGAASRHAAEQAVRSLESPAGDVSPAPVPARPSRGTTWVTRTDVFVDRIASAWLIRRHLDPDAAFKFVPARGYEPLSGEVRFDMFEGEFTHQGDRCTFEVLLERFGLDEPPLRHMADVVHDIDCRDEKFGRDDTPWMRGILQGVCRTHASDAARIEAGLAILDAWHASLASERTP